ncbi:MAG: quinolinate synthase NadA [Candidatus Margulisiibacteriota bacterium]
MITAEALYEKLKHVKVGANTCVFTPEKCQQIAPIINEINTLKRQQNAVILAHSYVSPEIVYGVADYVGDSYELSKYAKTTDAQTIVFTAVKFMAETAKLLNPEKQVLVPSKNNGCSLADSITGEDVRRLKDQFPEHTFVCYINTTADVKAECDVCVTSSNVYDIVEAIPNDKIYFLPDRLMGENVKNELARRGVAKTIDWWHGTCYVHEAYDPEMIDFLRLEHPGLKVLSHPECGAGVLSASDFVGSTSQMVDYVKKTDADAFFMLTECGLTNRIQVELPQKTFVGACTMCKYMKSNTLEDIRRVLQSAEPADTIVLSKETQLKALHCIDAMFEYTERAALKKR